MLRRLSPLLGRPLARLRSLSHLPSHRSPPHSSPMSSSASAPSSRVPSLPLNNGHSIPQIGFGTWRAPPNETKNSVYEALKSGYRHIDCARIYGNEKEVGEGIAQAISEKLLTRDDLFVLTKVWNDSHTPELTRRSVQESLRDLGLEYVDGVLIHWPVNWTHEEGNRFPKDESGKPKSETDPSKASVKLCYQTLEQLVGEGLIRSIGLSNHSIAQLDEVLSYCKVKPALHQVEIHPYLPQDDLLAHGKQHGYLVEAYSPLGNLKREGAEDVTPLNEPVIKELAAKYGQPEGSIVLRWGVQRGYVVLPKSVTPSRIRSNIDLFGFEIAEEDMKKINELGKKNKRFINPDFGVNGANVFPTA